MELKLSYNNFSSICRVCLLNGDLRPFSEPGILNIFRTITSINIDMNDDLPKNICSNCVGELTNIERFIKQCKSNNSKLRSAALQKNERIAVKDEPNCPYNSTTISSDESESKNTIKIGFLEVSHRTSSTLETESDGLEQTNYHEETQEVKKNHCLICRSSFTSKTSLSRHYKSNIKCRPKTYKLIKCDVCQKEFTTRQRKKEHMNLHTGISPYVCSYCGQNFKIYSTYCNHIYKHKAALGEVVTRRYTEKRVRLNLKCNMCADKKFSSRSGYANHLLTKHCIGPGSQGEAGRHREEGVKKFLCNYCAKSFYTKTLLEMHLRVHTDERPFECKECGKSFKQIGALRVHKLNHLENRPKPFKCHVCEKTFTQKDHCEVHKRTHTGEKPYSCDFCGKSFNYRTYWKTHLRMHTGEMPFSCPVCYQKYHDKSSLRKHQKKKQHFTCGKE